MRPRDGDLISGKYRVVRLIGDGGMGSVYEARHEYLGTAVALKFLHPELARRPGLVARFLQEARLSASIKSIHIARVTDVDQAGEGAAYLVMDLLEGESLARVLERQKGPLPRDLALDFTMQMLAGLEAAHAAGVVHRDLKPDNVFVVGTPRGPLVKLLDFGIAKLRTSREFQVALTRPGVMMGTPEYMAPEQVFSADQVDARADIYAVGTMLYEMLAGRRPAEGDDAREISSFILSGKVPYLCDVAPSVPDGLAKVVHRALGAMPEQRWSTAAELREALTPFCGVLSVAGQLAATPAPSHAAAVVRSALTSAPAMTPHLDPRQTSSPEMSPAPRAPTNSPASPPSPASPSSHAPPPHFAPPRTVAAAPMHATSAAPYATTPTASSVGFMQPRFQGTSPMAPLAAMRPPEGATQRPPTPYYVASPAPSVTPPRARRGASIGLLAAFAGATAGLIAIAIVAVRNNDDDRPTRAPDVPRSAATLGPLVPALPGLPALPQAAPPETAQPIIAAPRPPAPVATTARAPTKPAATASTSPKGSDAGAPVPSATFPLPFPQLPFPLPSAFPLPSSLPLPPGFPPIQLPGFPPFQQPVAPPAGSK